MSRRELRLRAVVWAAHLAAVLSRRVGGPAISPLLACRLGV
jgi:hypothetical protein